LVFYSSAGISSVGYHGSHQSTRSDEAGYIRNMSNYQLNN